MRQPTPKASGQINLFDTAPASPKPGKVTPTAGEQAPRTKEQRAASAKAGESERERHISRVLAFEIAERTGVTPEEATRFMSALWESLRQRRWTLLKALTPHCAACAASLEIEVAEGLQRLQYEATERAKEMIAKSKEEGVAYVAMLKARNLL